MHSASRKDISTDQIASIAAQFQFGTQVASIEELGLGNVNDTYLLRLVDSNEKIVLQCLNSRVFPRPELIMENLRTISEHVRLIPVKDMIPADSRWEMVRIYPARDGRLYVLDPQGHCWRAISYIANASCLRKVRGLDHAREAGRALGLFHLLLNGLDPELLHETLPGFHITPDYLHQYDLIKDAHADPGHSAEIQYCETFIKDRRTGISVLEDAKRTGRLAVRIIHGDPKIENIMIDNNTGKAVGLIDLDTVQPGLIHYDLGDCLRSCCNRLGEETIEFDKVDFDISLCRAILEGYFNEAVAFLADADYEFIYDALRLIAFELGLRFFTDYLAGNVYFKVERPEQNLARALVQFRLTAGIEAREKAIRQVIEQCRRRSENSTSNSRTNDEEKTHVRNHIYKNHQP